jgi:hypothetical protein
MIGYPRLGSTDLSGIVSTYPCSSANLIHRRFSRSNLENRALMRAWAPGTPYVRSAVPSPSSRSTAPYWTAKFPFLVRWYNVLAYFFLNSLPSISPAPSRHASNSAGWIMWAMSK